MSIIGALERLDWCGGGGVEWRKADQGWQGVNKRIDRQIPRHPKEARGKHHRSQHQSILGSFRE